MKKLLYILFILSFSINSWAVAISNLPNELEEADAGDLMAIDDISAGETKKISFESLLGGNALIGELPISNLPNELEEADAGDLMVIEDISAGETKKISFESLLGGNTLIYEVNGTYIGKTMKVTVDDASVVFGNALYCAADFHYERCDADAAATMPCRALALESGAGLMKVLLEGQICNTAWTWTAGPVYVSLTTGELTQTIPSDPGDQVQIVGFALSADTIYFSPDSTTIENL